MALQRHHADKLMASLFDKEASFDAGPGGWTTASACSLIDYDDDSAHSFFNFDDTIQGDDDVVSGQEFLTRQEIVRQSVRGTYNEPRVKPNTLAGLLGLCHGVVTSAQDGVNIAYRHKITRAAPIALPSIGVQAKMENGQQYKFTGVKGAGYTIAINGAYFSFETNLVGSGSRVAAADAFVASISENWLRQGDAKIFIKDTGGTPISIPATPSQGAVNLGGGNVDISTRVRALSHGWENNFDLDSAYKPSSGKVRKEFHPNRRTGTISFTLEADSTTEATELDYYLNQAKLALEVNIDSGVLIAGAGTFKYGLILIIPQFQLRPFSRSQDNQQELVGFEGDIEFDGTNDPVVAFVYNAQAAYLV